VRVGAANVSTPTSPKSLSTVDGASWSVREAVGVAQRPVCKVSSAKARCIAVAYRSIAVRIPVPMLSIPWNSRWM
jgi:hypothetical protein